MQTQVALIGAGPIGIEVAVALKQARLDYLHVEAGQIGNTIAWWAPGTRFFSSAERIAIAGVPIALVGDQSKCTREEYLAHLRAVVMQFDLPIRTRTRVSAAHRKAAGFTLTLESHGHISELTCKQVVFAKGNMDRPRLCGIPGENLPHVRHYFPEPHQFFRRRVVIVGGKNSAVEAALRCYHGGAEVTLSHRRAALADSVKYWLLPEITGLIKSGRIQACFDVALTDITPHDVGFQNANGQVVRVPADDVLLLTGYEADSALLEQLGVARRPGSDAPSHDRDTMETNVPGVFVAGTASAGTETSYRVFIENCHQHAERIVSAIQGRNTINTPDPQYAMPES